MRVIFSIKKNHKMKFFLQTENLERSTKLKDGTLMCSNMQFYQHKDKASHQFLSFMNIIKGAANYYLET